MALTIRQQIINAIKTRLQLILLANGYRTNAGALVFVDRKTPQGKDDLPCLLVFDGTADASDNVINGRTDYALNISIEAAVLGDTLAADQREIVADVLQAIGVDDTFGGLAYRTTLLTVDTNVEYHNAHLSGAEISIGIDYRCPRWEI